MVHRQPALHALDVCVLAPTAVLSDHSGQIGGPGHGVLHADVRVLSRASLSLDGTSLTAIRTVSDGTGRSRFVLLARDLGDDGPDPTVRIERHRRATVDGVVERIVLTSTAREPVRTTVRLALAADLIDMALVKAGRDGVAVPMRAAPGGLTWGRDGIDVTVVAPDAAVTRGELSWAVELKPRASVEVGWRLRVTDPAAVVTGVSTPVEWARPTVTADDRRLVALLERSLDDLAALRLATVDQPGETFLAAGAPWFFTLFGRDSLWAARLLLPLGTELAGSTLR
ncbi:MAG TPA: glycogen debranching N-terminal domain-containing protein, partial [Pseudonocardiaceae bacterium]